MRNFRQVLADEGADQHATGEMEQCAEQNARQGIREDIRADSKQSTQQGIQQSTKQSTKGVRIATWRTMRLVVKLKQKNALYVMRTVLLTCRYVMGVCMYLPKGNQLIKVF